jgi:hypothetical protein
MNRRPAIALRNRVAPTNRVKPLRDVDVLRESIHRIVEEFDRTSLSADERRATKHRLDTLISDMQMLLNNPADENRR